MKLTKLIHSCLLVEEDDRKILVDPGNYSWSSQLVRDFDIGRVDAVAVTHAHPDHLSDEFAKEIAINSPDAKWYGPEEVVQALAGWGITAESSSSDNDIHFVESVHADLSPWFDAQPEHTSFMLFGSLLIGGDCHTLTDGQGADIFGAAVSGGPWGAVVGFTKMIEQMQNRPKKVVPLHDWHWQQDALDVIYSRLPEVLSRYDVEFVALESGVTTDFGVL